jgi:23S rRNA (adenine2503-C2)-methyltransferase
MKTHPLQLYLTKENPLDLSIGDWHRWCQDKGLPKFTGNQIIQWIYQKNQLDPSHFTNLPLKVREALTHSFSWEIFTIEAHLISQDLSEKFLLKTADGLLIEMVLMPYENRLTLCISSQVGCRMGCTFCQTGKMGFKRNLTSGEIIGQILFANQRLRREGKDRTVTNVVFMGMGEPLDNYEAVVKACSMMIEPQGLGLSKSRVTISTSGLVPEIRNLGKELPVRLAISLHTAVEEERSKMMPINRKYSLKTLKEALLEYPAPARTGITFEYVMIQGENDTIAHAKALVKYVHGLKASVNLIPINHFPGIDMEPSDAERIRQFQLYLSERSIPAPVRYSRGQDISGGCGQLAAKNEEELNIDPRQLHAQRRQLNRTSQTTPLQSYT